ncbi:hypothetical protein CALCODRAFT_485860 [Calocera cornea HHB12733]|uniref:Uncharacterized protein n=1 Tax=Calocera cornea HHB12733 TaxID=1353952 RepID=A0A165E3E0_9BASI|nr:hypothetical protein CALCODRAFT_485860 [Calocera cornea HHB12733]
MRSYDLSTDMMLEGLDGHSFSDFLAGQPRPPADHEASISDAARILAPEDLESLLRDLQDPAITPHNGSDISYSAVLKDLPPLFVTHGMPGEDGGSGPPAGQTDPPSHSEPARPSGREIVNAEHSCSLVPCVPDGSSSESSSNLPASHSTPDHSSSSSSTGQDESPSAGALVAADESGNPFWDQIMESSFEDDDEDGQEIAEAFKKRAKIICSTYYKDTFGHASGALPPDSRTAIKFCRQMTRGLVEFLCQHYNLQQQRVWKEIGAFVGWARSINAWNMFQRKWRDELPRGLQLAERHISNKPLKTQ